MERNKKEKSKSDKLLLILNFSPEKQKIGQSKDISTQLKSSNLGNLTDDNFDIKLKKLFDSKKFTIGNQFDQEGSEKFLAEKDECLKAMDLDYTVIETKKNNSKKDKKKRENKSKNVKKAFDVYIPEIKITDENNESFFSKESSIRFIKEFVSKSN